MEENEEKKNANDEPIVIPEQLDDEDFEKEKEEIKKEKQRTRI